MPDPRKRQPDEPDTDKPTPAPADDHEGAPNGESKPGDGNVEPPGDLDDGPLVAANVNLPGQG